ncbi:glycosyltransferase [Candidatus Pelagibacter sp. Uisw_137]|uniref:glycosyltransferase n=1 Tax=Candidatus Pelagibacter sp. Uisw_137 TaxID=3230992 RepID=UPI0039ED729A
MNRNISKKITIILIAYKSEELINTFVKKIPNTVKVIIIENSNNLLLKRKIEKKHKNIKVYIKKNEGVSASINYAAKKIKTEFFLQISPDIKFDYMDINKFIEVAKKLDNKFSALGPRFLNVNNKSHKQINKNLKIGSINSIHGSFMFINKKKFKEIGGFDNNFFLYFEETDYCKRASNGGLKAYQINEIKVKTEGRSVLIKNKKEKKELNNILIWHFIWSKYYFTKKNYGLILSLLIFLPIIIRIILKIIFYQIINKKELIEKYKYRLNGLMNSIKGKNSSLRP